MTSVWTALFVERKCVESDKSLAISGGKIESTSGMFACFVLLLLLWIPQRLKSCSFLCLRSNVHQGVGILCHLPSMSAVKILSRRRVS